MNNQISISANKLTKRFGDFIATNEITFEVRQGEIFGFLGANGAGKTTASYTILPEILNCKEFVNADEIARGLSPFQPETVSFHAGRIMLERISELLDLNVDFAIETTLTTLSYKTNS